MTVMRLYSGDDGESHIEEMDPATDPGWLVLQQATGIMFRTTRAGFSKTTTTPPGGSTSSPFQERLKSGWPTARSTGRGPETRPCVKT